MKSSNLPVELRRLEQNSTNQQYTIFLYFFFQI